MANRLICRTCLKKERPEYCKNISPEQENEETSNILEMLNYCVPELDIHLVMNPVICRSCINMLETAFKFKTECLKIEEKFLKYSHSHSMNSKVDLKNMYEHVHLINNNEKTINNNKETINVKAIKVERTSINDDHIDKLKDVKNKKVNNGKKTSKFSCAKCYGCEKKLTDPSYHSKLYQSPFKCYNCGKQVNTINDFRKHMNSHRRQRKCKICSRFFRDLHQLTTHIRSHTGAKPFTCNICSKSFQQKHSLSQHLRQHAGHSTVNCTLCDKSFSTKYNFKIHMRNMHAKKKPQCELCGEKFQTKVALVKHLETDSETCGNFVKTEVLSELAEEQIIKTEPEFIYANDNIHNLYKQEDFESEPRTTFDEEIDIVN